MQIAEDRSTRDQFALKFFISSTAFLQEKKLYLDPSTPLGKFLPQLHTIAEGENALVDAQGNEMPSCIVMEKGESLDTWAESSGFKLDMFTGLQVLRCHKQTILLVVRDSSIWPTSHLLSGSLIHRVTTCSICTWEEFRLSIRVIERRLHVSV